MPLESIEHDLQAIREIVERHPDGIAAAGIEEAMGSALPRRTLGRRLAEAVKQGIVRREGVKAAALYFPKPDRMEALFAEEGGKVAIRLSKESQDIRDYLARPQANRRLVSYQQDWLESYQPGTTYYLSESIRAHLARIGRPIGPERPAGTFARDILNRLLIDLSWASSHLEGNTYSRLDTQRLIEFGQAAEGKDATETQMILNHKAAVEFLVNLGEDIAVNRYTVLNLHAALSENLMGNPHASGSLRMQEVMIAGSVYYPPASPERIARCFETLLSKAHAIEDPHEQAFFLMVHLPYLQPFDDVNKRVSRLAANIPFIRGNLSPLSFVDVPRKAYIEAVMGVYELTKTDWLRDLFVWAYERSCQRYTVVRDSLAEPDIFRMRHGEALIEAVGGIVRAGAAPTSQAIRKMAAARVPQRDLERFVTMALQDFERLRYSNIGRYRLTLAQYEDWKRKQNS